MIDSAIRDVFSQAGCDGWLCVSGIDDPGDVRVGADEAVVAASVFKVVVALEVFRQGEAVDLDLRERVRVRPEVRTAGPTGFSLFADEVEASVRDLVTMMLTISDNAATDILLERVGMARLRQTLAELGLERTVIPYDLRTMLDSIGRDAGFDGWAALAEASVAETQELRERVWASRAMRPEHTIRTTAGDMARLLALIWRDAAGPGAACAQVRAAMARQLTRNRLAAGFPPEVSVAAKSGSLFGVIRNEIGVVRLADGSRYAAAVFTRAHQPYVNETEINTAIGAAAALAVDHLVTIRRSPEP